MAMQQVSLSWRLKMRPSTSIAIAGLLYWQMDADLGIDLKAYSTNEGTNELR
jgi:hypothetical protein